jgi:hypothetical protein
MAFSLIVVDYKTIKRELSKRLIYECRCDERINTKSEGFRETQNCHDKKTLIFFFAFPVEW